MQAQRGIRTLVAAVVAWWGSSLFLPMASAAVIDAYYAGSYTLNDLGAVPSLPTSYGGLTLLAGTPDKLLIGGSANTAAGNLYVIDVTRDMAGHINGFSGVATAYADAPYNDGGVTYGPGGVLFASQWPVNMLSQYLPGSTTPDKVIDLAALGVAGSHAALNFVPPDYSGAGQMKLVSWSGGEFYTATYTPDGMGTYDILSVTQLGFNLSGGPEGFVYVPNGSPLFPGPSMLVSEYSAGMVGAYDVDANGDPISGTRRTFITGLTGAEGAFIDPYTGDFLFSTFGAANHVIVVQGFADPSPPSSAVPEPSSIALLGFGCVAMAVGAVRRRKPRAA